jgi:BMFP domain-containing protein YqiC
MAPRDFDSAAQPVKPQIAARRAGAYVSKDMRRRSKMANDNPFLDQLAKLMTNAAGAAKGMRDEIGTVIKTQAERIVNDLDLVPREEFEAMKAMALKSQREIRELNERLATLTGSTMKNDSRDSRATKTHRNAPIHPSSPTRKYRR